MATAPKHTSDATSYHCPCPPSSGKVLLFYRYFANPPRLPSLHPSQPLELAQWHKETCTALNLTGKIRIASEGVNVTVAGGNEGVEAYVERCCAHWSFAGLPLGDGDERDKFFKPTEGCAHVFEGLSVKITEEATPFGAASYVPSDWIITPTPAAGIAEEEEDQSLITYLSPPAFHALLTSIPPDEKDKILLDTRNHYESSLGQFTTPTLTPHLPPIRKFSSLPAYLEPASSSWAGKDVITYCTGGIRCEKAARYIADTLPVRRVYTLHGGIQSYLTWFSEQLGLGLVKPEDSVWKGRNYVFDARGSTGIEGDDEGRVAMIGKCGLCGKEESAEVVGKCAVEGCHLVMLACKPCAEGKAATGKDWECCEACIRMTAVAKKKNGKRKGLCVCEQARVSRLNDNNP
ncbi:hypothetical protein YB2330_003425 [Saitoella coloradoensis]